MRACLDAHPALHAPRCAAARPGEMPGVGVVPGFAVGRATRIERREIDVTEQGGGKPHEQGELERARANVRLRLERMRNAGGAERREIIGAHLEFLDDPGLNDSANELIAAGKSAGFAWRGATRRSIAALQSLDDSRLRERADDLLDVEAHVLLALAGEARPMHLPLPEQAILLADDLLPSELTALDRRRLAAIALSGGGATSHVAILAAAMEIPMLIGIGPVLRKIRGRSDHHRRCRQRHAARGAHSRCGGAGPVDRRSPSSREAPRCARRRLRKADLPTAPGLKCSRIWAAQRTRGPPSRTAPRAVDCFEPSFYSSIGPPRPRKRNN